MVALSLDLLVCGLWTVAQVTGLAFGAWPRGLVVRQEGRQLRGVMLGPGAGVQGASSVGGAGEVTAAMH